MPTYSYECNDCLKTTELICPFSEKTKHEKAIECDFCKSKNIRQVFKINIISGKNNPEPSGTGGCCGGSCGCH